MGLFPLNGKSITFEIHKDPSNLFIMVLMDSLASALKNINNAEKRGKRQVLLRPCSKVVVRFLKVMMKHGYIGEFEVVDDHRGGKIVVNLTGRLNKVGIISPRFDIGVKEVEKWTNNLLPSRQFPLITNQWAAMVEFYKAGKAKTIGVSNYCKGCYDGCLKDAGFDVLPHIHQIQYHLGSGTDSQGYVTHARENGMQVQAYSTLASKPRFYFWEPKGLNKRILSGDAFDGKLGEIAHKHNVS